MIELKTKINSDNVIIMNPTVNIALEATDLVVHWLFMIDHKKNGIESMDTHVTKITGILLDEEENIRFDLEYWPHKVEDNIEIDRTVRPGLVRIDMSESKIYIT